MKSFAAVLAAAFFCASVSAASAATVYKCDMHSKGTGGFIGDVIIFILAPDTSQGMVFDGLIKSVSNNPISAEVTKRKDTIWAYKWVVRNVELSNSGRANVNMRGILNIGTGALSVSGRLVGGDNNISGSGTCSVAK